MTGAANELLLRRHFVFNRLQHYAIEYDTSKFAGSDAVQLKRALAAGKLDEVPPGRREMETSMEFQWLAALSLTQLSSNPELFVQKRFLDPSGALAPQKLDARKLVTVEYSGSQGNFAARLVLAVIPVEGLYAIGARSEPHQVFISRNVELVWAAAGITEIRNARPLSLAQAKADAEELHKRLPELANIAADAEHRHSRLLNSDNYSPSPVRQYTVDSPTLNGVTCPDTRRLSFCISAAESEVDPPHRIYQASFDFRVAKGVMILSPSLRTLYTFCRQKLGDDVPSKAREYDSDPEDDSDDEEASASGSQPGFKRRASAALGGSVRARKRARRTRVPLKYHVLLRYRETRAGVIHYHTEEGMLKFVDEEQLEFSARIDLSPYLGLKVELTGRKVCDVEEVPTDKWRDFTRARYDQENAARLRLL
ncbi:hypothetical protein B0T18DRAFT_393675 [Schizothecium vesticola]|uniref:Uncharacterized protein n=1 Tax=Schizothecium vesticola TaxID=314040 RepID=A0AA40EKI2_9PEZI|nr:hypothetical protein B0T18DRAFT_393675 [Schizothecium vesticola]